MPLCYHETLGVLLERGLGMARQTQNPMKVLLVVNSLILAGAEMLVRELAPRLRDRGLQVEVAVLKLLDSPLEEQLGRVGIPVWLGHAAGIYSPRQVRGLAPRMAEFDLVHSHLFPAQLWVPLAADRARRRPLLVTTEHNTSNRRRNLWLRPLDRWMYRRYDAIACNSQDTADALVKWLPRSLPPTCVIHNGIPLGQFRNAPELSRASILGGDAPRLVINVARLEPQKDQATLLRAAALLPSDVHIALVGDGSMRPALESLARDLAIASRVHFLGRRPDVPALLKMADLFVLSSLYEGFGISTLEAMAAGVPVVASAVAGLSEMLGDAGLQFVPGDAAALARQMAALLDSQELRASHAAAGLRRAAQFSIEACADAHVSLYESLARQGKASAVP